jgi:hypothetical protein
VGLLVRSMAEAATSCGSWFVAPAEALPGFGLLGPSKGSVLRRSLRAVELATKLLDAATWSDFPRLAEDHHASS